MLLSATSSDIFAGHPRSHRISFGTYHGVYAGCEFVHAGPSEVLPGVRLYRIDDPRNCSPAVRYTASDAWEFDLYVCILTCLVDTDV